MRRILILAVLAIAMVVSTEGCDGEEDAMLLRPVLLGTEGGADSVVARSPTASRPSIEASVE